jgi:hypothetical protein
MAPAAAGLGQASYETDQEADTRAGGGSDPHGV